MSGKLIYLMGPSGSGKDSLLQAAAERLQASGCRIARRVITRSAESVGEDALGVSGEAFARMTEEGAFALSWHANGLDYGIPKQIDDWLASGRDVLVNGSRGYLPVARQRYPDLLPVLLEVQPAVLRERLIARGRENHAQIEARLARNAAFDEADDGCVRIDNSGALEDAVNRLIHLIMDARACV
ncbi:phosphonate metabolism protein/1,5-bisphosphokinase (PRPP-forming) PhnN [Stutzerimonas nitrititolerans]|uniref:phosphonate metabolism protein/1,5-bisphosphokinase (PRPP-forming) PhnN n=1 Tax=Stutzerimonas nitrititolerans TaxID=2482751 RepID=UPI0028AD04D7|nr:phosphonate metabolism protein/1,5-bisphosphokinase (PRPP-forming) PhnN [Stutzerimonas nitrititolerans]